MIELLKRFESSSPPSRPRPWPAASTSTSCRPTSRSLEEDARRLSASLPSEETPGDRIRVHVGDGDRQYLTGLKVGGSRILFLVDASASMLGSTIVNVIRRRNLPERDKVRAAKWQQALATVDWLTTQIPRDSQFPDLHLQHRCTTGGRRTPRGSGSTVRIARSSMAR